MVQIQVKGSIWWGKGTPILEELRMLRVPSDMADNMTKLTRKLTIVLWCE